MDTPLGTVDFFLRLRICRAAVPSQVTRRSIVNKIMGVGRSVLGDSAECRRRLVEQGGSLAFIGLADADLKLLAGVWKEEHMRTDLCGDEMSEQVRLVCMCEYV
jgi:hypothetical protein